MIRLDKLWRFTDEPRVLISLVLRLFMALGYLIFGRSQSQSTLMTWKSLISAIPVNLSLSRIKSSRSRSEHDFHHRLARNMQSRWEWIYWNKLHVALSQHHHRGLLDFWTGISKPAQSWADNEVVRCRSHALMDFSHPLSCGFSNLLE